MQSLHREKMEKFDGFNQKKYKYFSTFKKKLIKIQVSNNNVRES